MLNNNNDENEAKVLGKAAPMKVIKEDNDLDMKKISEILKDVQNRSEKRKEEETLKSVNIKSKTPNIQQLDEEMEYIENAMKEMARKNQYCS